MTDYPHRSMDLSARDTTVTTSGSRTRYWAWSLLFIPVLLAAAALRTVGMDWDAGQHLHPDERFLTMVTAGIDPVQSLGEYFDTPHSSLNPNNRGFGFYVYGTLPIFIVRYVAEAAGQTGYDQVYLVGRYLSALFDLLTVLLVYLTGLRLYRSIRVAVLAGAFYALAVLPIQLSHYFTVDSFLGFFGFLTFYCAVLVMTHRPAPLQPPALVNERESDKAVADETGGEDSPALSVGDLLFSDKRSLVAYLLFGAALGMAVASKVSAAPLAVLLPVAAYVYWSRLPHEDQARHFVVILRNLALAALVSLFVFRLCQPYAFSGPGFFGLTPNPQWVSNLKELSAQSTGDVDFPPALQWARRPIYFAWENMVRWGMGLPLGLLAWGGFLWMGWRMLKGGWQRHLLLWGWTLVYFTWQEINFTRSMRYQILVYPTLAIIAAWALIALWERRGEMTRVRWNRWAAGALGAVVLAATAIWAVAFAGIYSRPVTRVAASDWIYQNVPAAINARIQTAAGETVNVPMAFRRGYSLSAGQDWRVSFSPQVSGVVTDIRFSNITTYSSQLVSSLSVSVGASPDGPEEALAGDLIDPNDANGDGRELSLTFDRPLTLMAGQTYTITTRVTEPDSALMIIGPVTLGFSTPQGVLRQPLPEPVEPLWEGGIPHNVSFTAPAGGVLSELILPRVVDWEGGAEDTTLLAGVSADPPGSGQALASASLTARFTPVDDPRGQEYTLALDSPVQIEPGQTYYLSLQAAGGPGKLALYGSKTAIESTWDDSLPLPLAGLNPFDRSSGLYPTDLNFEMYWDDNSEKLERFTSALNQADYIFISSNRQWGTTTRVPERYPLASEFYRRLIGCPPGQDVITCYANAAPGMYRGDLGFELAAVFHSNPRLGPLEFNTQFAEEAFTVYDHPKVLVFKKGAGYSPTAVYQTLASVDLSNVVHVTPRKAKNHPANLMLPPGRLAAQRSGGSWSDLFDTTALLNLYPGLALVLWYLVITLLGWVVYPFVRLALRGLPDRGYPLSKLVGVLLLAYFTWLAGSAGILVSRLTISLVALLILMGSLILALLQRDELERDWQEKRRYFLAVELAALGFFALDLLIRFGNPDLWHPYKGGEKPMDFAYFNAVLKSTTFPPYNPWFSGAYINYYYFGFVIAAVPVKWLGIVPAVAYNLILPTFFSFLAMAAFSFGWNLLSAGRAAAETSEVSGRRGWVKLPGVPLAAGLASAVGLLIMGNWGTVRMNWHGLMKLAAPEGAFQVGSIFQKLAWTGEGLVKMITTGAKFSYYPGDWYWIPSRAYPGLVITEFPFFTFLYGDPHAHLFALPLTVLALSWALSILLTRWKWGGSGGRLAGLHFGSSLFLGGLVIGSLRPVNTWDLPTYLVLGVVALLYTALKYGDHALRGLANLSTGTRRFISAAGSILLLVGLSFFLFQPYLDWYAQGYNSFKLWEGERAPFWSYLTHWGVFLFVITTWLVWETREWMAATPASSLRKLKPYSLWIQAAALLLFALVAGLLFLKVTIAWLVLPLAAWAAVLLLRPGQPDVKRAVLFMVGSALTLTLFVEVIVLEGDVERMNTVFKFYLQAWTLLALSSAAALVWLWPSVERVWALGWRYGWTTAFGVAVLGALLFPLMAGLDKITDRMNDSAPHTLDGMAYMPYGTYSENGKDMHLDEDYLAIRWMQENVPGSPVIVEAHVSEYRWGSRYSIYTGLPSVLGWNWHTRQQRVGTPDEWVWERVAAIEGFYLNPDPQLALDFLRRYDVRYIVVGQLERALYPAMSLEKFTRFEGQHWKQVFQQGETTIYEVLP